MNFMQMLTPLTLSLAIIALIFAIILVALDMRRSNHQKSLRQLMLSFVSANATRSFSVITEVINDNQSIDPLLSHLESQNYSKLQVLVFVDASVINSTVTQLRKIQRKKRNDLNMRIVRRKANHNERALIRRYANGDALVWLSPTDRITPDFLTRLSIELLDESRTAFAPRAVLKTDDTIRSATRALQVIARQTVGTLTNKTPAGPLVIRRSAYLNADAAHPMQVEHSAITVQELAGGKEGALFELLLLLILSVVTALAYYFISSGWYIIPLAFGGIITLLMLVRLVSYPYSFWNKLSLVLLIPLWPFTAISIAALSASKRQWAKFRTRRSKTAEQT